MKILMICKHNRFRSKVAEAIFNTEIKKFLSHKLHNKQEVSDKLNKNEENKARSRGIILDKLKPYVEENVIRIMAEKGYSIENKKPLKLCDKDRDWADKIIIVADNVPAELFPRKVEVWEIEDCSVFDEKKIREIIGKIEEKVKKLVENIKV